MTKRRLAVAITSAAIAAVVIVSLTTGASAQSNESTGTQRPLATGEVRSLALGTAGHDGEMAPTEIQATSGTLAQAAHATDPDDPVPTITDPRTGRPWAESPVEVVTMRGHFTSGGPHPAGTPEPTGTVLTVTIDSASGRIVSQAIGNAPVAMEEISPTVTKLEG
jgi:hypothetical protein